MHILLIEDDERLCETLQYQFEQERCRADTCQDGRDGLELLLTHSYDLAILDRMLPSMDGLTILRTIREKISRPRSSSSRPWESSPIKSLAWTAARTTTS